MAEYFDEALVNRTRNDLNLAVQAHMAAIHGPVIATSWYVSTELIDADDDKMVFIAMSENMTAWELRGMSYYSSKLIHTLTA